MSDDTVSEKCKPFFDDALDRKKIADKIVKILPGFDEGKVITIDAIWGNGKTYFGKNFADLLRQEYRALPIFIDAFENDYVDDPFLVLCNSIYSEIKNSTLEHKHDSIKEAGKKLLQNAVPILKAITLGSSKIILSKGMDKLSPYIDDDVQEIIGEASNELIKDGFDFYIADKIVEINKQKRNGKDLKLTLTKMSEEHKKCCNNLPVVIIVDELDRCNPTFTIHFFERIKHFFDIPNIVFILLINKDNIYNAIRGVYGANIDAENYFEKFVDFSIALDSGLGPIHDSNKSDLEKFIDHYVKTSTKKYKDNFDISTASIYFLRDICRQNHTVSLRDVQKIIEYLARDRMRINSEQQLFIILLAVVKIKYPLDYLVFLNRDLCGIKVTLKKIIPNFEINEDCPTEVKESYGYSKFYSSQLNDCIVTYCKKTDKYISGYSSHPSTIIQGVLDLLDCKTP
jgi:hypothetical protein